MTEAKRLETRAMEAVSHCLMEYLNVPNVYWNVRWPSSSDYVADVLLIDRAGVGDPHVVEIKLGAAAALKFVPRLRRVAAPYRWIAFFADTVDPSVQKALKDNRPLYPSTGPGRIGVIHLLRLPDDTLKAVIMVVAERFAGNYDDPVDRFTARHKPTMSYR
jgi:hypothetical protein